MTQTRPKKKWVAQEVQPPYEGPRLTGGEELRRLFAIQAQAFPTLTEEDLPRLPQAGQPRVRREGTREAPEPSDTRPRN
eukprot:6939942-Heterocapsa_arctica.AAC.1